MSLMRVAWYQFVGGKRRLTGGFGTGVAPKRGGISVGLNLGSISSRMARV